MFKNLFANLQKVGKALMLPVSVLPVAGILLGVGAANFSWLPDVVSQIMEQAGGSVFGQMPLLFAVGCSIRLYKQRRCSRSVRYRWLWYYGCDTGCNVNCARC